MAWPFAPTRSELHAAHTPRARRKPYAWPRIGPIAAVLLLTVLSTALVAGCSAETRYRMLSKLFEDVPKPGEKAERKPVVNKPRRPPPYVPAAVPAVAVASLPIVKPEQATPRDWREFQRQMPKDAAGSVDWVRALEEKLIKPRAGVDPEAAPQPVFPLNVELVPPGQPLFKVTFPHKAHTEWLACANCHPAIFKMQRGADPINMAKIFAGEYCGRCHGKVSFAVPTGCPRCHLALAGPK